MVEDGERVLVVDGNSLVHRSYHALAGTGYRSVLGRPIWAVRGLLTQVVAAVERVQPTRVVVGFDDPARSERRDRWPAYKAHRADKPPTLVAQLAMAAEQLQRLGVHVVTPPGLEADDVLASVARWTDERGGRTVVVTSDRDAFALITERTSVLRVIHGGIEGSPLLTPERLELMAGVPPHQYRDLAALRGDPSDNLPGVEGIGPKRAALLLARFGSAEAVFVAVAEEPDAVAAVVGPGCVARLGRPEARANWRRNIDLMTFVDDLDCGLGEATPVGRLPLDADDVHRVLVGHGLPATAQLGRRVLGGVHEPAEAPPSVDHLGWDSRAEWHGRVTMPPLPVSPQPALF